MKRIWKDLVIIGCFICLYCTLVYAHMLHMQDIMIKEIPYIALLLITIVFLLWSIDKLKIYQIKSRLNQKMRNLSDQYDLAFDEEEKIILSCERMLNQLHQKLKEDELNLNTFEYRYRKIANITGQIIFEYNLVNHTICDSMNWHAIGNADRFIEESIKQQIVHPEDAEAFRNYFTSPAIVGTTNELIIRLCTKNDPTYYYTRICGTVLEGLHGEPEKIIGTRVITGKAE